MVKNHFWRVVFCIDGKPAGSMLVICPTVEIAISRGAAEILKQTGKHIEIVSCGNIFWTPEEENDFFKIIENHGSLL